MFSRYSPAILLFLISIIPSIWILELHHHQNISIEPQCNRLDSWAALRDSFNGQNVTSQNITSINNISIFQLTLLRSLLIFPSRYIKRCTYPGKSFPPNTLGVGDKKGMRSWTS
ncbi:unnamed protein product [Arctogadus glacialis]